MLGNKLGNSALNNAGTELAQLIVKYPYDHDNFSRVIAKTRDVRRMIDQAKEAEKQKEAARAALRLGTVEEARKKLNEDISYEDFEDKSEGEPKPWFYSIMKVNRPDGQAKARSIGQAYEGVADGKTVHEVTLDNYRVRKGPTKEERFQRDNISSRLKQYLDHVVGLKGMQEKVERVEFENYYDMHYEYRDEKGKLVMMMDHHFHQNGEEEGFMLHYFFDDSEKAREVWSDVKELIEGKKKGMQEAA